MSRESDGQAESLSPISRRAFFRQMGTKALKLGALGAAAGSLGPDSQCNLSDIVYVDIGDNCGYCDGEGRDYDHCDGDYCDYINYEDGGGYADNCGYCDGECRDYEHCDGDYCDYINYSDSPNCVL